jgi:hypothetical protein
MKKPDKSQKVKLHPQTSLRSTAEKAERVDRAYANLIAMLNRLGYYPETRAEAKKIAEELLTQGWEYE